VTPTAGDATGQCGRTTSRGTGQAMRCNGVPLVILPAGARRACGPSYQSLRNYPGPDGISSSQTFLRQDPFDQYPVMDHTLVRRDQFIITPQGILHRPTDAAFTPNPGDPHSGILRLGQMNSRPVNGGGFLSEDVQRIMRELWTEYVGKNPGLFPKGKCPSSKT
jgi:hypothetical protein